MKKRIAIITMVITLIFSSMTVYAEEPTISQKPAFLDELSVETAQLYGCWDTNYDEIKEIVLGDYYYDRYGDLKIAFGLNYGVAPNHYIQYGLTEGRLASPVLDVAWYRDNNPDLQIAFGDDWDGYVQHYFQYGILEGRDNGTDFKPEIYLSMHPDLQLAFGSDNYVEATKHYLEYGYAEGREYQFEPSWTVELKLQYADIGGGGVPDTPNEPEQDSNEIKKINLGDGAYLLLYYEDGVVVKDEAYDENGVITRKTEHENEFSYTDSFYEEGQLTKYIVTELNSDHYPIKRTFYDTSGAETYREEFTYDADLNVIETRIYHSQEYTSRHIHEYDAEGKMLFEADYNIINGVASLFRTHEYEYYANGERRIWTIKDANGNLKSVTTYTEDGEIESEIYY